MMQIIRPISLAICLLVLVLVPACADSAESPLKWSKAELVDFVQKNSGLTDLKIQESTETRGHYSGTGWFNKQTVDCTVKVTKRRVSWEAKSDPKKVVNEKGTEETGRMKLSGSVGFWALWPITGSLRIGWLICLTKMRSSCFPACRYASCELCQLGWFSITEFIASMNCWPNRPKIHSIPE